VRAVRGRSIKFEALARHAVGPSGAPFPDIFRERLRVSKAPLAALGAGAALTRAARSLSISNCRSAGRIVASSQLRIHR
jgi:hypothetical protein